MGLSELVDVVESNIRAANSAKKELEESTQPRSIDGYISLATAAEESLQAVLTSVPEGVLFRTSLAQLYIDTGDIYLERQNVESSAHYFSKALEVLRGIGEIGSERLTREFSNEAFKKYSNLNHVDVMRGKVLLAEAQASKGMSRSLTKQGNSTDASTHWSRAKAAYETILSGRADQHTGGIAFINYGNMLLEEGNREGARQIYLRAIDIFSQLAPFYAQEARRELRYLSSLESKHN